MSRKKTENIQEANAINAHNIYYPHLKITSEKYPRLLATRKFLNSKDEYFGAFLPKTALRIRLYNLNKIFRLRNCQIKIDGDFPQPCQMFFLKKCVAPCVSGICTKNEYDDYVHALRLFLNEVNNEFQSFIIKKIDDLSESLEFEKAARWRDIWRESQDLTLSRKNEISLENAVDTYSVEENAGEIIIYLMTTRGRKFLGNKEFIFQKIPEITKEKAIELVLKDFYRFHTPREIRVPFDFPERKITEKNLREKHKNQTKIIIVKESPNKTAEMHLIRTKTEFQIEKLGDFLNGKEISQRIQTVFNLKNAPLLIESFDVAHISNQDFITANSVWENGEIRREKAQYWKTGAENEPEAMAEAVKARLTIRPLPDLILIDGGRGQLNAVLKAVSEKYRKEISFVSAVKPPGKHNNISYFLTAGGDKIDFIKGEKIHELLRNLRDEAHRTANELHRQYRDNKYIFEVKNSETDAKGELPLVIIRFDEAGGAAEDLQPIKTNIQ